MRIDLSIFNDEKEKFLYDVEEDQFKLIQNLIEKRIEKNMTQRDIANKIGLSQQAVSRIEKYGNAPSITNLIKYLRALDLDINSIFKEQENIYISEDNIKKHKKKPIQAFLCFICPNN